MARRSNFDLIGRFLFMIALPRLIALPFRLIAWCWRALHPTAKRQRWQKLPGEQPDFYKSRAWQNARVKCFERNIKQYGVLTCELCFQTKATGVRSFHCHHKRSRSNWPELALDQDNLVAACEACNMGMGNRYEDLSLKPCTRKGVAS